MGLGSGAACRLENSGILRRVRLLAPRPGHLGPDSAGRGRPGSDLVRLLCSAVDDTKVHRSSPHVWGTCTFHEYTARCPNRAPTVRAHNWVVLGTLLPEPEKPAWFLPISGRLYFRKSQLPVGTDGIVEFRTKCELAIELLREQARIVKGKHLAVSTAATPWRAWSGRWSSPRRHPRIDFLTRLRCDARLYALPGPGQHQGEAGTAAQVG